MRGSREEDKVEEGGRKMRRGRKKEEERVEESPKRGWMDKEGRR